MLLPTLMLAQETHSNYEKYLFTTDPYIASSVALDPLDPNKLAIATVQGKPIVIFDWRERKIIREIEVEGHYADPNIFWSDDGKYLLLEQKVYADFSVNKDRPVEYQVLEVSTGKILSSFPKVNSACFLEKGLLAILRDNTIEVHQVASGQKVSSFGVGKGSSAIAPGTGSTTVFVARKPEKEDLQHIPSIRNDRKAKKPALKYRQVISEYDLQTGKLLQTLPEIFDVVYEIRKSADGKTWFIYSTPHLKINPNARAAIGYISQLDRNTLQVLSAGFQSNLTSPDFKINAEGNVIGVMTATGQLQKPSLLLYDRWTGKVENMFQPPLHIAPKLRKKEFTNNHASFVFLPGSEEILFITGNQIFQWKAE